MGLFDYMFDGYKDDPRGLFDGLFSQRWEPVQQGLQSGVMDPQGMNNTSAYTAQPPAPQFPIQPPGGMPPRAPNYTYGGSPETNPLLRPMDPQNAPQPMPRQPQGSPQMAMPQGQSGTPGFGDRIGAGFQGAQGSFFNGGGPIGAIVNLLGGLATGKRTDPQGVANEEVIRMYHSLQKDFGLSEAQARATVMHPDLAKETYKALVNSQPVILPDGSVAMPGMFGAPPKIVGAAPKPEPKDIYDEKTQRMMPGFITPPSAANPQMKLTLPGQGSGAQLPGQNSGVSFSTGPSVSEKKQQEDVGAGLAADYVGIQKQALSASNQRTVFQRMRQLNEMPNLGQGGLAPIFQTFKSAMVSLNLGDPSKVKPGEEFNSLANGLVTDATGGSLGNQISNTDRDFLAARIPQLSNTKDGRTEMLQTLELLAQRKVDIAKEAMKYRSSHGGNLDGFQTYISDWAEQHPLFKDRPAMIPGSGDTPSSSIQDGQTATNPTTGKRIIFKGGQWQPM